MPSSRPIPSSILIVGSGVFGLSTAYALAQRREEFAHTTITLVDRVAFPAPDGASIDSSRIIRPDYPDRAYAALMGEAHKVWRGELGGAGGVYTESGLAIFVDDEVADDEEAGGGSSAGYYVEQALATVVGQLGLTTGRREDGKQVTVIDDEKTARAVMGTTGGHIGSKGYVNWTSGWAHAEDGMRWMRRKVEDSGRVETRTAEIDGLVFNHREGKVDGVRLAGGEMLTADLTILATGAWTPKFIDLRGIASATGQVMAYTTLTQAEQDRLGQNPVLLSETTALFIIPPRDRVLKVARHGYGYANPVEIPNPEQPEEKIVVSLPRTKLDDPEMQIPAEGDQACRDFLAKCIPDLADRPWTHSRICWYTDSPSGDWLIDYHPKYSGLFVATAGSGHGYKFLPVIGERVVDVILGQDRDELGGELRQKWAWPKERKREDHVWTGDWRAGRKGMILEEEYLKT